MYVPDMTKEETGLDTLSLTWSVCVQVDLVVCCTRVDLHYETIKPSIQQGKSVYVEWPLASNLSQALELASLAKQKGAKTMVGYNSHPL